MSKYLILGFRNAKLFRNKKTTDRIFDILGTRERKNEPFFLEPITRLQVSNMLHEFLGERPVSSIRTSLYDRVGYIDEIADNSYLKITTCKTFNKSKNEFQFINEFMQTKKALWNSHSDYTADSISWPNVKRYFCNDELFEMFKKEIEVVIGKGKIKLPFYDVLLELNKVYHNAHVKIESLTKFLRDNKKVGMVKLIETMKVTEFNKTKSVSITVTNGVESINILSGEILVPVDENLLDKIRKGKGSATILDGGLVYIKGVANSEDLSSDGFDRVGNISLEKY